MSAQQEQSVDQQQITEFVDDVAPLTVQKEGLTEEVKYTNFAHDSMDHSIQSILARPIKIATTSVDTTDFLYSIEVPSAIFNASTNLIDKLNYFTFMRANVHFRVVFNATPFQQGKYWLFFSPYEDYCGRPVTGTLPNASGFPGVQFDLASGEPAELKVPFVSPLSHMNLLTGEGHYGKLFIRSLVPLNSGTSGDTFDLSVYAWFTEVELSVPTNEPVNTAAFTAQIFTPESSMVKPTSVLSRMASPGLQWVSDWVTGALNKIGYCKPTEPVLNTRIVNEPAAGFTHVDSPDTSVVLAARSDNSIEPNSAVFGTTEDEMDIKHVTSKWNIPVVDPISWPLTSTPGTLLVSIPVTPGYCKKRTLVPPASDNSWHATHQAFVMSMFEKWRGSMKYKIQVAKTAFHTGRLQIAYQPFKVGASDADHEFMYNWILDLSQSSEISVEIPFLTNKMYLDSVVGDIFDGNSIHGYLKVYVLNELRRSSASVADAVTLLPWVACGDNIEFAIPSFQKYQPYWNPVSTILEEDEVEELEFEAQIFGATQLDNDNELKELIGNSAAAPLDGGKLSMGERIDSLRVLTRRFAQLARTAAFPYFFGSQGATMGPFDPADPSLDTYSFNTIRLDDSWFGETNELIGTRSVGLPISVSGSTVTKANLDVLQYAGNYHPLQYISYLYRFYRGGRRYKVFMGTSATPSSMNFASSTVAAPGDYTGGFAGLQTTTNRDAQPWVVSHAPSTTTAGTSSAPLPNFDSPTLRPSGAGIQHVMYPDINGVMEFETPYYSRFPVSLVSEGNAPATAGPLFDRNYSYLAKGINSRDNLMPVFVPDSDSISFSALGVLTPSIGNTSIYMASSDNFSFGYLVGARPLTEWGA